jgi:ABC-type spermidine/putrescine transport system permease subunit I
VEKMLVKTGIYSFILSFFLFVVFLKREKTTTDFEGMSSYEVTPFPQFFFQIFRYSVIISIIGIVIACAYVFYQKNETSEKE